jgi:hypothetical protein
MPRYRCGQETLWNGRPVWYFVVPEGTAHRTRTMAVRQRTRLADL